MKMLNNLNINRLLREELNKPCKELAQYLLGKMLVRKLEDGTILKGRIVETESYLGGEDKGSHSYNGRFTAANEPMYMPAGTVYVYMTYGMYHCMNISAQEKGAAVLLRALEPIIGIDTMRQFRSSKIKSNASEIKTAKLCDGPSKLCISFNITKENLNKVDVTAHNNDKIWLEDDPDFNESTIKVVRTSRIGIGYAGVEWSIKPLRFYILNSNSIRRRDKAAEEELNFEIG